MATEVVGGDPGGGDQAPSSKWRPPQNGDIPSLTGHKIKTGFQGVQSGRDRRIEPRPLSPGGHLLLYGLSPDLMHAVSSTTAHRRGGAPPNHDLPINPTGGRGWAI